MINCTRARMIDDATDIVADDLPVSTSLWDDLDILKEAKSGDKVIILRTGKIHRIEWSRNSIVSVNGIKFRKATGDEAGRHYNAKRRILPLTTRTAHLVKE